VGFSLYTGIIIETLISGLESCFMGPIMIGTCPGVNSIRTARRLKEEVS
jgi:hypothetical protein